MITWMLVSIKLAKLLVNVFWTAKMTIAVKQIACRYSKMNTQSALVRFVESTRTISYYLIGTMSARLPMWQLSLWFARKESSFNTLFTTLFKAASSYSTKWWVINFGFLIYFIQGGVNKNFEFTINDNTEVYNSCSSMLNGEVFVFGGSSTSNNRRKQVNLDLE